MRNHIKHGDKEEKWLVNQEEREGMEEWLKEFMPLYEKATPFIQKIIKINADVDAATLKSGIDAILEGYQELSLTFYQVKALPKPKEKELRKLKQNFEDVLKCCGSARKCLTEVAQPINRFTVAKLVFWTGMAKGQMEDISKILVPISRAFKLHLPESG